MRVIKDLCTLILLAKFVAVPCGAVNKYSASVTAGIVPEKYLLTTGLFHDLFPVPMPAHIYHAFAESIPVGVLPVDHVTIDPPYAPRVHEKATTASKGVIQHNDLGFAPLSESLRSHVALHVAAATRWSWIYSDAETAHLWIAACEREGATFIRTMPWIRWSGPQKSGDRPVQGFEVLLLFWGQQKGSKRPHWHGPGTLVELAHECELIDIEALALRHKAMRGKGKHKCQKPLDQALDLFTWFTEPGSLSVDFCAGSGTHALAAQLLGRSHLGFERNPDAPDDQTWVTRANERLALARSGRLSPSDTKYLTRWLESRKK